MSACCAGGALLTGAAFFLEARWGWQGVAPEVLVSVGTALALAGVLFVLERRFVGTVARASRHAASQAVARVERHFEHVERQFEERAEQLSARLDELQSQMTTRMRDHAAAQDQALSAIDDHVSYETVTAILTEANRLNAFDHGQVIVQASADPDGLRLGLRWGTAIHDGRWIPRPSLEIQLHAEPGTVVPGQFRVDTEWREGDSAAEVGHRLARLLMRSGQWHGDQSLDWGLALANLKRSASVAISSRRRAANAWHLHGELIELVGSQWAITCAGVEAPEHEYILRESDFPELRPGTSGQRRTPLRSQPPHVRPEWADPAEWQRVLNRAGQIVPRSPITRASMASRWRPWDDSAHVLRTFHHASDSPPPT